LNKTITLLSMLTRNILQNTDFKMKSVKYLPEYVVVQNSLANSWDSFLEKHTEGNLVQCFNYGEILPIAYPRKKVARFSIIHNGEPVGIVQGTYTVYLGIGITLAVELGPIVNAEMETKTKTHVVEFLVQELEAYCKKKRIIHLHFSIPDYLQIQEVFRKMNYTSAGKANEYVVNLKDGAQKLWLEIHHNKRRNIKRALKDGVEITQSHKTEDLETFYSLYYATSKKRSFNAYPRSLFDELWKNYNPELTKVFLANLNRQTVSGVFLAIQGKTVYALGAGSLAAGWAARPNDLMHWKAMEWASENHYLKYDMGEVDEPPPTEGSSRWGIWRWKKEWKGNFEGFEKFDKIILPRYKLLLDARDFAYKRLRKLGVSI